MRARKFYVFCYGVMLTFYALLAFADDSVGTIKSTKGEVGILRNGSNIQASAKMKLMKSDKIITGPNSSAGVTLQDGTLLSFGPKSVSQLNEFQYDPVSRDGNMLISVLHGSMRFVTGLMGKHNASAVNIRTSTATIGIRGTDFIVSVDGGH